MSTADGVLTTRARPLSVGQLEDLARTLRADALRMTHLGGASHIGSCLSSAEILAVLYGRILKFDPNNPRWEARDRFIMSKGHAAAIYYAVLAESGFFPRSWLDTYYQDGSQLCGHTTSGVPGVEHSTGSLGHGLAVALGMAIAGRMAPQSFRSFALLSDGECDEGSVWEAALFAAHHGLDNLVAVIDYNKIQSLDLVERTIRLEPLASKWNSFGWATREVDGHDTEALVETLEATPFEAGSPSCIVAHTVKGKGVSFMEHRVEWHYRHPSTDELQAALQELENGL